MKLKIIIPAVLALAALLPACKNDLKVLAPYKETVSVYGLINPNESTQKIRINKVFLGEGDANVMAMNADSINYGAGELTVSLERYMDGSTTPTTTTQGNTSKKSIVLTETVVATASGAFNNTQRLYITNDKLYATGNYKLIITDNHSGKQFTAQTVSIDSVRPGTVKPIVYNPTLQPAHPFPPNFPAGPPAPGAYIDYTILNVTQKIKFKSVLNARLYQVVMRFHYRDSLTDGTVNNMIADYTFPTLKSNGLAGGEDMEADFTSDDFYKNVAQVINQRPAVTNLRNRASDYIEYIIYAGTQDLSDFLQVNAPATTIAQDKPYYTNVTGGVGIFAARSRFSIGKDLYSGFIDAISTNHYTCPLRFCNSTGSASSACF